jgi:3-oxoacyl-[acyl-carrier protein] reductase
MATLKSVPMRHTAPVVIVTAGAQGAGREVALQLASWGSAIVVVYLDHQRGAEATVEEIFAAGGRAVAVRADVTDDLDVERLFAESVAAFGGVDAVVHTTGDDATVLDRHARRHLGRGGAIVSVSAARRITPAA